MKAKKRTDITVDLKKRVVSDGFFYIEKIKDKFCIQLNGDRNDSTTCAEIDRQELIEIQKAIKEVLES